MNTRELSMTAIVAALYAALVIVFAPISFGPIQLRIADCLIPISALLGFPAVAGVGLGALIGNMYWFLSPIDVIFGSIANLIAGFIILKFRKRLFLACITASLIIGIIVGGYLWLFFPPPWCLLSSGVPLRSKLLKEHLKKTKCFSYLPRSMLLWTIRISAISIRWEYSPRLSGQSKWMITISK